MISQRIQPNCCRCLKNSEDTIMQLMTDKLQLMLINVLFDQFLNTKVSQGSIATRLRCDGIFNDYFITQSMLSPTVKFFF